MSEHVSEHVSECFHGMAVRVPRKVHLWYCGCFSVFSECRDPSIGLALVAVYYDLVLPHLHRC